MLLWSYVFVCEPLQKNVLKKCSLFKNRFLKTTKIEKKKTFIKKRTKNDKKCTSKRWSKNCSIQLIFEYSESYTWDLKP